MFWFPSLTQETFQWKECCDYLLYSLSWGHPLLLLISLQGLFSISFRWIPRLDPGTLETQGAMGKGKDGKASIKDALEDKPGSYQARLAIYLRHKRDFSFPKKQSWEDPPLIKCPPCCQKIVRSVRGKNPSHSQRRRYSLWRKKIALFIFVDKAATDPPSGL